MKKFDQWQFPDHEKHLTEWMTNRNHVVDGRLTYQYHKYEAALPFIPQRRLAIDVGSHIGLWSFFMARDFEHVAAFEPVPEHQECWYQNMKEKTNAELFKFALGASEKKVAMRTENGSSGNTDVIEDADGLTDMHTLDSFNFPYVDLIKIDCEGYEYQVLRGAVETLRRCKPCVIVEQKGNMIEKFGGKQLGAVRLLMKMGYTVQGELGGDYIMTVK